MISSSVTPLAFAIFENADTGMLLGAFLYLLTVEVGIFVALETAAMFAAVAPEPKRIFALSSSGSRSIERGISGAAD